MLRLPPPSGHGALFAWGSNAFGQLGLPSHVKSVSVPEMVDDWAPCDGRPPAPCDGAPPARDHSGAKQPRMGM